MAEIDVIVAGRARGNKFEVGQVREHLAAEPRADEGCHNLGVRVVRDSALIQGLVGACYLMFRLQPHAGIVLPLRGLKHDDSHRIFASSL